MAVKAGRNFSMAEPEPIRISALGRDAHVGDFYNYFTDLILPSGIEVPEEYKKISETENKPEFSFFYQKPDKFKRIMLNINSHLQESINKGSVNLKTLWFANYLTTEKNDSEAEVTVFIRVTRRSETLDPEFLMPKMFEYQLRSGGRTTHLIEKVVYGAEIICSIHKFVDRQQETKENVERSLYYAAKKYFDQIISQNSATTQIPFELDEVRCVILNSLEVGNEVKVSFQEFSQHLINVISCNMDEAKWKPIEILLRDIPAQIETQLWLERKNDIAFLKEQHEDTWNRITKCSRTLLNHPSLNRFPPFEKVMCQFKDLLTPFLKKIENSHDEKGRPMEQVLKEMKRISDFLTNMTDWLDERRKEIEAFTLLLNGNQLDALHLEDIKIRMRCAAVEKIAKVFVLIVNYNPNVLVENMQKEIGRQTSAFELPVLRITTLDKTSSVEVRKKLHEFASEADLKRGGPSRDTCYHIALTSLSSSFCDGEIKTVDFTDRESEECLITIDDDPSNENFESQQKYNSLYPKLPLDESHHLATEEEGNQSIDNDRIIVTSDSEDMEILEKSSPVGSLNRMVEFMVEKIETKPTILQEDSNPITNRTSSRQASIGTETTAITGQDSLATESPTSTIAARIKKTAAAIKHKEISIVPKSSADDDKEHDRTAQPNSSCGKEETTQHGDSGENITCKNNKKQEREREYDDDSNNQQSLKEEPLLKQKIGKLFATNKQYSKLIKKGQPDVYELNSEETLISEDFRCFDMGQPKVSMPSNGMRNHKVIILMGATGCGKSTLINGMVNYILGVQWGDPFRFKCVREDETIAKNQAHSQTSSVTAYTLRHHQGMAVPYSITIIDTPGYGDTRGIARDKEITRKIHQFLTQQETRVEEIHAACFVAASGNSRLTATQGYIIDSVLSIFGKDVKENIRLLVTFADNAHPPVVEACLAANFPVTSVSAGITFSKFNSSVLYAKNKQGDDDFSFDELFWDMGQENFQKFFTMLEKMNGKDLKSTRNVIQSRKLLEQSLEDIEQELEVCLVKIENMEMFHRKMKIYGHKMESNKNFTFEKTEMHRTEVPCDKGFFAYNCHHCRNTCERPKKEKRKGNLQNIKRVCDKKCPCPASEHELQPFEWRMTPVKITTTLKDMKAEYESSYNDKITIEQLLANCYDELNVAKAKVFSLLDQVDENVRLLQSTALRSSALTPSDYLSMMKSRVAEEQAPGYLTRLETLTELQNCLAADASASASHRMTGLSIPNRIQQQSSRTGGAHYGGGDFHPDKDRPKSSQFSQRRYGDSRFTTPKPTGAANYSPLTNSRTSSGPRVNQPNNNQLPMERPTIDSTDLNSREHYSSDDEKLEKNNKNKKVFLASFTSAVKNSFSHL